MHEHHTCEPLEPRRLLTSVTGHSFDPDVLPQGFTWSFDTYVGESLDESDFSVENLSTNQRIYDGLNWSIGPGVNDVRVEPGTSLEAKFLPNGNYETYLSGSGIFSGTPGSGQEVYLGSNHRADFWFLNGDFNSDRSIDLSDFAIIRDGTSSGGTLWSEGDMDGDADVDDDDYALFQNVFGATLPAAPLFPGQVNAYATSDQAITIEWATPTYTIYGFRIFRSEDGFSYDLIHEIPDPTITSWSEDQLLDGTEYWYRVRAYTNDGNTQALAADSALTLLPAPSDLSVFRHGSQMEISWNINSSNHDLLRLERSIDGGPWQLVDEFDPWTFDHTLSVADGHRYDFRLWAVQQDAQGVDVQTSAPALLSSRLNYPHEAPWAVDAEAQADGTIIVRWQDLSSTETGFLIERSGDGGQTWSSLGTAPANATSHLDSTTATNVDYVYRVTTQGSGTLTTTQDLHAVNSNQASTARPNAGDGYFINFNGIVTPPFPGWSTSQWNGAALGPLGNTDVTFSLNELKLHSYLSASVVSSPTSGPVYINHGDDLEVNREWSVTFRADDTPLYRLDMIGVEEPSVPSGVVAQTTLTVLGYPGGIFPHISDQVTFTFDSSGFSDPTGPNDHPTSWRITNHGVNPLRPVVDVLTPPKGLETPAAGGQPGAILYKFHRVADGTTDNPLTIDYEFLRTSGGLSATFGEDFVVDGDFVIDVDGDGDDDNYGDAGSLTFPAGERAGALVLRPVDDEELEPHELLTLRVRPGGTEYSIHGGGVEGERIGVKLENVIDDDEVRIYLLAGNGGSGGATQDTNGDGDTDAHDINDTQGIWTLRGMLPAASNRLDPSEIRAFTSERGNEFGWSVDRAENFTIRQIERDIRRVGPRPLTMAMAGYSWGGGMLSDITERLPRRRGNGPYFLKTTAYIDAIEHETHRWRTFFTDFIAPAENSVPVNTQRHLNFYQGEDDPNNPLGNWPNGGPVGGFIQVNMDINAAVRNSPNVGRSLFADVGEAGIPDPGPNADDNQFVHLDIHLQEPILKEIVEWFVHDLL